MIIQRITRLATNLLEKYYEQRLKINDKEIVYTGNRGAIFFISLLGGCLALIVYLGCKLSGTTDLIVLAVAGIILTLFVLYSYTFLGSKITLNPQSITLKGPVKTFEDNFWSQLKIVFRESLIANRTVEMSWNEIDKIARCDNGLYFYTKSGHRFFFSIVFFNVKIVPMIKKYKDVQDVFRWI